MLALPWHGITLTGKRKRYRVNKHHLLRVIEIWVQAKHFGPQLPPEPSTQIGKTKKRSIEALDAEIFPFAIRDSFQVLVLGDM